MGEEEAGCAAEVEEDSAGGIASAAGVAEAAAAALLCACCAGVEDGVEVRTRVLVQRRPLTVVVDSVGSAI